MKNENFPIDFTKENKSFIFWFAMINARNYQNKNEDHFNYWLNIAFENFEVKTDSISNELGELLSIDLSKKKYYTKEVENIYSDFSDQLESDKKSKEKLNTILEYHYSNGFSSKLNDSQNTTKDSAGDYFYKWIGLIAFSNILSVDSDEVDSFMEKALISLSDENLNLELTKKHESDLIEARKGIRVFSIYEQVCDVFASETNHFKTALTGYIAASFKIFDSEEEHEQSSRTGSYRYYLRQNVKSLIKTFQS